MKGAKRSPAATCRASALLCAATSAWLAGCSGSSSDPADPIVVDAGTEITETVTTEPDVSADDATAAAAAAPSCELAPGTANGHLPVVGREPEEIADDRWTPVRTFAYDVEANRFSREIVNGFDGERISRTEFAYDDAGRLTEKVEHGSGGILSTTAYEYDGDVLIRESAVTGLGVVSERVLTYDDRGRLTSSTRDRSTGPVWYTRYEYGADGFIESASDAFTPTFDEVLSFTEYDTDERGRIIAKRFNGSGAVVNEFDDDGNVVAVSDYGPDGALLFRTDYAYERTDECVPNWFLHVMRFDP